MHGELSVDLRIDAMLLNWVAWVREERRSATIRHMTCGRSAREGTAVVDGAAESQEEVDPHWRADRQWNRPMVRPVHFLGWQSTSAGEREVKQAPRRMLLKYQLHKDQELFDKA